MTSISPEDVIEEETSDLEGPSSWVEDTGNIVDSLDGYDICRDLSTSLGLIPCLVWNSFSKSNGLKDPAGRLALISNGAVPLSPTPRVNS